MINFLRNQRASSLGFCNMLEIMFNECFNICYYFGDINKKKCSNFGAEQAQNRGIEPLKEYVLLTYSFSLWSFIEIGMSSLVKRKRFIFNLSAVVVTSAGAIRTQQGWRCYYISCLCINKLRKWRLRAPSYFEQNTVFKSGNIVSYSTLKFHKV